RLYRHFIVLSTDMERRIRRWHPRANCARIPEGVPDRLFHLPIRHGTFILFLGRLDRDQKGVDLLLRAFAAIPVNERVPVILAGNASPQERCAIERLIADLDLAQWITAVGRVDEPARERLLADCRFVCVPSRQETFGMVIAEGCAAG